MACQSHSPCHEMPCRAGPDRPGSWLGHWVSFSPNVLWPQTGIWRVLCRHYTTFQRTSLQVNCVQCRKVLHGSIQYISNTFHYITVQWNTLECSVGGSDRAGNDKLIYIFLQHSFSQQLSQDIDKIEMAWIEVIYWFTIRSNYFHK